MALLGFALLLRLLFMVLAGVNAPLTGDEVAYQQIAVNVASGLGFWEDTNPFFPQQVLHAWQAPVYPLSLAAIYFVLGQKLLFARLFGIVISTATVYVTYDLAARVFEDQRAALASGLLLALYPGFLTNAHLLLSETLFSFCVMLAFDLVARGTPDQTLQLPATFRETWYAAAAGTVWGLATLTRGITLYFAPILALWIVWNRPPTHVPRLPILRSVIAGCVFLVMTAAVIAPWTIRNYAVFRQFVLLETKGGVNFWLGNSPYTPPDFIRNVWKVGVREPILGALPADEVQRDRTAYALGMAYVTHEPATFMARMPVKFADLWGFERNLSDVAEETGPGRGWNSPSKLAADAFAGVMYVAVMIAAIFGLTLGPNRVRTNEGPPWKLFFGCFIAYFCAIHVVVFGDGRFHLPLIPVLVLYGGWFLANLRNTSYSRAAVTLSVATVMVFAAIWVHQGFAAWDMLRKVTKPL